MFRTVYRLPIRLLGIPVHLDVTFLIILPLLGWIIGRDLEQFVEVFELTVDAEPLTRGIMPFLLGLVAALGLFTSVLIHELGHSVVGQHYGLKIKRITLWILGGMAQFESMPRKGGTEAIMAIAGPITSLLVAGVSWFAFRLTPVEFGGGRFIFAYLMYMNVILAVFNLLPALPLDGGRVMRSLLAMRMPYLKATQISASMSKFLAVLMGLLGFLSVNIWLMLIAFFIYMAVSGESGFATASTILKGIRVEDLMSRNVQTVFSNTRLSDLIAKMMQERHLAYPVLNGSGELVGMVTLQHVRNSRASGKDNSTTTVEQIMSRRIGKIRPDESALEAFQRIHRNDSGRLVVVDGEGRLQGILSKTDLVRAVQVRMVGMEQEEFEEA